MASQSEARQRLAVLMDKRRLDLRLTWQDVAEQGDVSLRALANARTGDSEIRPLTRRGIEAGLQWEAGSVDRTLDGGYPVPEEEDPLPLSPELEKTMRHHLSEVKQRIRDASRTTPPEELTGQMLFPFQPGDRANWDQLRGFGYSVPKVAKMIAVLRVDDDEIAAREQGNGFATGLIAVQVT
jgi:hypothetical protein